MLPPPPTHTHTSQPSTHATFTAAGAARSAPSRSHRHVDQAALPSYPGKNRTPRASPEQQYCLACFVSFTDAALSAPPPKLHMQLSRPREQQDLHRLVRMGMWTKLRPGVREFLQRAAELFELWIYTAGSKPYAEVCGRVGLGREGGGGEGRREGSSAATCSACCVSPFTPEILQRVAQHFLLRIYSAGSKPLRMWVGAWRVL